MATTTFMRVSSETTAFIPTLDNVAFIKFTKFRAQIYIKGFQEPIVIEDKQAIEQLRQYAAGAANIFGDVSNA